MSRVPSKIASRSSQRRKCIAVNVVAVVLLASATASKFSTVHSASPHSALMQAAITPTFTKTVIENSGGDVKIVADLDGDGFKDLIVGGSPGEDLRWFRYPSWDRTTIAVPARQFHTDGEAGDVDGDGDDDIVVPDDVGDEALLWFANPRIRPGGTGNPLDGAQWVRHVIGPLSHWGKDVELSDFDGNGLLDVAVRTPIEHMINFQMTPSVWNRVLLSVPFTGGEGLDSGDVDRDGDSDLIVEGAWLRNPGGSAATSPGGWTRFPIGPTPPEFKAVVTNIDADPAVEIVFGSSEGTADVTWWDPVGGNPTGSWSPHTVAPSIDRGHTLQAADMDADGDMDVIVGQMHTSTNRELAIFLNQAGDGLSWQKLVVDQHTGIHNGIVADIGNDGDFDIFGANWSSNPPVALWVNTAGGPIPDTAPPSTPTDLTTSSVSATQINLSWNASTDNVAVVGYRVFRNGVAVDTTSGTGYADSGLVPSTTYAYRVSAFDAAGNESGQSPQAYTTTAPATDSTPPVISNVASDVGSSFATITWTTNESASSRIDYGTTIAYDSSATTTGLRTLHALTVMGLQPATMYHYRVRSVDAAGNERITGDFTFSTASVTPDPPPVPDPDPPGLIAHWELDEGGGSAAADSAGPYHGTLINGPAWSAGHRRTGVRFDGVDDYIEVPALDVNGSALTIAAWAMSSGFPTQVDQRFISKAADSTEQGHYWMLSGTNNGENRLRFRLKAGGTTTTLIAASGDLPIETWYHVAATYDGTMMRVYLNGNEIASAAKSGALAENPSVPVNIGRNPDGTNYMFGVIDDVRIYNRALTGAEVVDLVNVVQDSSAPSTPTDLSAVAVSASQVQVSWSPSTDNVGVTGYRVFRNDIAIGTTPVTGYADIGLAASTSYVYRVSAQDDAGNESAPSMPASTTTAAPGDVTPPVISNVTASDIAASAATITWTTSEPANSRVDYGTTVAYDLLATTTSLRTSHALTLTGLQPATTYHYRVRSEDAAANERITGDFTFTTTPAAQDASPASNPAGLIAHWRLDEGNGNTAADSAGSNNATLVNGATWSAGHQGAGVRFDGIDDYIHVPGMNVSGPALTMAAWVNSSSFPARVDQRFISKATGSSEEAHYWMLSVTNNGENRLRFRLKTGAATTTLVASSGNLPSDTWYHVAATYDGTQMRLYFNGIEVGAIAKTGSIAENDSVPVEIGRNPDGTNAMSGVIDDVRIYNRALTAIEIVALMEEGGGPI